MGKPKSVSAPKVPDPIAMVQPSGEEEDYAKRKALRRSGFKKNVLAGSLEPMSKKRTKLG